MPTLLLRGETIGTIQGVLFDKDGTLSTYSEMIDPSINTTIHEKGRKILIAIGGWGNSDEFSPILSDSLKRITFISNIISFLETNQYDGVDIDWEFPSSESDRKNLSIFINDLTGQIFSLFILTVAAAEAAIGLAIIVVYYRNSGTIRVEEIDKLKG